MIQFPINVYPHNVVIDIDKKMKDGAYINPPIFSFVFNGEKLKNVLLSVYDNTLEDIVSEEYFVTSKYNGKTVTLKATGLTAAAQNGYNYKYKYALFQGDKYDIFVGGDEVEAKTSAITSDNMLKISKGASNIPADPYLSGTTLIGGCYVEINRTRRFIRHYDSENGIIYLDSAFSTYPAKGTHIKIFANFTISPYYFFKARNKPVVGITSTISQTNGMFYCKATYSQDNNIALKSYKFSLFKLNETSDGSSGKIFGNICSETERSNYLSLDDDNILDNKNILLSAATQEQLLNLDLIGKTIIFEESGVAINSNNINGYSNTIIAYSSGVVTIQKSLNFVPETDTTIAIIMQKETKIESTSVHYNYDLNAYFLENVTGNQYRVQCDVLTQENDDASHSSIFSFANASVITALSHLSYSVINDNRSVHCSWINSPDNKDFTYNIYRKRIDNHQTSDTLIAITKADYFDDYLAANNQTFKYYIVPTENGVVYNTYETDEISIAWDGWSITKIVYQQNLFGKRLYNAGSTWLFYCNIDNQDITFNTDRTVQQGYSIYPKISIGEKAYSSGSFQALLDSLYFVSDCGKFVPSEMYTIDKWRSFINTGDTFLLKSDKGDAWVVAISESTSTSYDETVSDIWTTIKYNWVQVDSIGSIVVV